MPAPKVRALALLVVAVPLLADAPMPDAEVPTSNGLTGSRPLYLQGPADVDEGRDGVEVHWHGVGTGRSGLVAGVVDRLAHPRYPGRWARPVGRCCRPSRSPT